MVILLPHPLKYGEAYYRSALVLPNRKKNYELLGRKYTNDSQIY